MIVLCLEGVHGCGKTSVIEGMKKMGIATLDECFLNLPTTQLHPQSLTCEVSWLSGWFMRILQLNNTSKTNFVICDRSPYSAVFYSKEGHLLEPIIKEQIDELAEIGIDIRTVYLRVDAEELWNRIVSRLEMNPERKRYNEHKRAWMNETIKFYEGHAWNHVYDNTKASPQYSLIQNIAQSVLDNIPDIKPSLHCGI